MIAHDVLIVGGGLSGLMAAANIRGLSVGLISKVYPNQSHSGAAQGGFNAAMGPDDRVEHHIFDTVKGSDYLGDQDAIEVMCQEGPNVIRELERLGVLWSRDESGAIGLRSLGGASHPRTCFVADMSGHAVLHTLYEQSLARGLHVYNEWHLLELLVEDGQIAGAVCFDLQRGRLETFRTRAVILATGGYGRVYAKTTNSLTNTGDGIAIAFRAGAILSDMEFVQFHPTSLYGVNILVSEAARGEGGFLYNAAGERFMARYAPGKMELAPRDIVSRAIAQEIREGRGMPGGYVHLDVSHLGTETIRGRLPSVQELAARHLGVDITKDPFPIEPAQHYSMGGIRTNSWGETNVPGLFAAGECANVSVHGANRLGGNSLLETVVFGRRAGLRAQDYVERQQGVGPLPHSSLKRAMARWEPVFRGATKTDVEQRQMTEGLRTIRDEVRTLMMSHVGVFRTGAELKDAAARIADLQRSYGELGLPGPPEPFDARLTHYVEVGYLLDLAQVITAGALAREESRGAHYRSDFPERRDDTFLHHTFAARSPNGEVQLSKGDVTITRYRPKTRGY